MAVKQLKQKKCRHCKELFSPFNSMAKACSVACAIGLVASTKEKEAKRAVKADNKKHAERKREYRANDTKIRKAAAKKSCHLYIRARDAKNGCICCHRPLGKNYDAGHFIESGNGSFLRYHEDNIHAQSVYCNQYKGGDSGDYEENLRAKIGDERVDWLKANKNVIVKRTAQDYKAIEDEYNRKYKELRDE